MMNTISFGQWSVGNTFHLDLYKPYSEEALQFMAQSRDIKSNLWDLWCSYSYFESSKWQLTSGIKYQHLSHLQTPYLLGYYKPYQVFDGPGPPYVKYELVNIPVDLKSVSHKLGIINTVNREVYSKGNWKNQLGASLEIYPFEVFYSNYRFTEKNQESNKEDLALLGDPNLAGVRGFLLTNINASISSRFSLVSKTNKRFSVILQLGTNLYSDWDQFKKYVWLGVGLEYGFDFRKKKNE